MTSKKDIEKNITRQNRSEAPIFSILLIEDAEKELIYPDGKHSGFPDTRNAFTVGYFFDLDEAISVVETNAGDIRETIYNAAFILCLFPGLYQTAATQDRMYFAWDEGSRRYIQHEEPGIFEHIAL